MPVPAPPPPAEPDHCPNCGADRRGAFCHACGQHYLEAGRLTLRGLWNDFAERFLRLERGLFHTVARLSTAPGHVALDYVRGRRRRYISPLGYLLLATSVAVLLYPLYADLVEAQMATGAEWGLVNAPPAEGMTPEERAQFDRFMAAYTATLFESITRFTTFFAIALGVVLALFLRLFFGGRYVLAEHGVLALYVAGHYTLVTSLLGAGLYRLPPLLSMAAALVLLGGYLLWAALAFYGRRWSTVGLTVAAFAPSYVVYLVVVVVIAGVYALVVASREVGLALG